MGPPDPDWLNELKWSGSPALEPQRDYSAIPEDAPAAEPPPRGAPRPDPRLAELGRENEGLRARLDAMARLASEFEKRLSEAGIAYETALLQSESRLRDAELERQRLAGEVDALKAEGARLTARDAGREADLRLERERRADSEKALHDARRRLAAATEDAARLRAAAAEQAGAAAELRAQASAQNERLLQAKALTDQDVLLLRQEMREFLAKFHRIQETYGEKK